MYCAGEKRPSKKKCCVPGCLDKDGSRFRFPNKNNKYWVDVWLKKINNPKLMTMPFDTLYQNCVVCERHFLPEQRQHGTRRGLKPDAVPVLFLTDGAEEPQEQEFQQPQEQLLQLPEQEVLTEGLPVSEVDCQAGPSKVATNLCTLNIQNKLHSHESYDVSRVGSMIVSDHIVSTSGKNDDQVPSTSHSTEKCIGKYGILKKVNVTRQKFLTPKAKHFYKVVVEKSNKLAKMSNKMKSYQARIRAAESVANSPKFEKLMEHVNSLTYRFILSQVRNQKQKPKARRYTLSEKILALTILKASGRGYKLLSKIFTLPSKKTLTELLKQIPFPCGVNKALFERLQEPVRRMQPQDRMAILVFDEMAIDSLLQFNSREDHIEGLHDLGNEGRKPEIADYANVFMLKGVFKQWKQPICYSFNAGPTRSSAIKQLIVEIIKECQEIHLEIVATVCDQGSGNQAAINMLLEETKKMFLEKNVENRNFGFMVNNEEVVPLYDTPHLFKGLRNNLLSKDLHFEMNNKKCVAKWKHYEQFYLIDSEHPNEKVCPKLTDQHIIPEKINKMKVKCCTQVFSHQVGSLMKKILMWKAQVDLDPDAMDTADLTLFLDKLFDSVNSSHRSAPPGKPLKGGVTSVSNHFEFWYQCINIMRTMKYYCHKNKKFVTVPSVRNFIKTLEGFIYLSKKILERYPRKYILLRVFQQDALENFLDVLGVTVGGKLIPVRHTF